MFNNRSNFSVRRDVKLNNITVDRNANLSNVIIDSSSTYVPSSFIVDNVIPIDTPFTKINSGYDWSTQTTYSIVQPKEGTIKFLSLLNDRMAPIKLNTNRGSIVISSSNPIALIFINGVWRNLGTNTPPWFVDRQQGEKLIGSGGLLGPGQGYSISLSADGNTLATGGYTDNEDTGAVWIFTRTSVGAGANTNYEWSQQGVKIVGANASTSSQFGFSLSLSADGNTLAVGGPGDTVNTGAVWIYTRNTTTGVWSQQGAKLSDLTATDALQGSSVSLSADGNTLAVGGPGDDTDIGATWIYTRNTTTGVWSQQGSKLTDGAATGALQGRSVSLSADGNTLASAGPEDDSAIGAVWIYIRSSSNAWSQQGSKLVGTDPVNFSRQGYSVSLSADGNTLAVGGYNDDTDVGATWIFTRSSNVPTGAWTQQGSKLIGTGATGGAAQGSSVSLSADGNTLAVGGYADNSFIGAVWIFTRSGSSAGSNEWSQQGSKLVGTGNVQDSQQGISLCLSADGTTLAVGGYMDDPNTGAVWIFT